MADFVLELLGEEIPARMQARAAGELGRILAAGLGEAGLAPTALATHATPRRLIALAEGLATATPATTEERKGPRADAPPAAIEGFLRQAGLRLEDCERRPTPKGDVLFAVVRRPGRPTGEVLAAIITRILGELPWPKTMRWGESPFRWIRPLHHILAVFDGRPLAGGVELDAHRRFDFTRLATGHRYLSPQAVPVDGIAGYLEAMHRGHVVIDRQERRRLIAEGAARLAAEAGVQAPDDPGLLEEVAGLVEWPVVLAGRIDEAFMDLPAEVLVTAMRTHQRYFACRRPDGRLAPLFILVANTTAADGGRAIATGNERVLRARLADARFFWDQDRKVRLGDRVPALGKVVFHARLGSMEDKVGRLQALAAELAPAIPGADLGRVRSAALLAKADLSSGMVGEFPELQGVMGRYYALDQGEDPEVADAIARHYAPLGPADACPIAPVSIAVALADKIDTLAGFFAIGEKPTGSRDPYALRRAALGVIRLIRENGLRIPLGPIFDRALAQVAADARSQDQRSYAKERSELLDFIADRLKVALRDQGVRHDLIDAVFALGGEDDIVRLLARVDALARFLRTDDGANLLTAWRRAANIVRIEARRDGVAAYGAVDPALLAAAEEQDLAGRLAAARAEVGPLLAAESFDAAMGALARLRLPVDAFFDRVTVNVEDAALRANRLALLQAITATMNEVADFARLEG